MKIEKITIEYLHFKFYESNKPMVCSREIIEKNKQATLVSRSTLKCIV